LSIKESEKLRFADVSKRFKVGISSLVRWSKKIEPQTKRNKSATKIDMEALKRDVELYPDAYQPEQAGRLGVSQKDIFAALKRLRISYKKHSITPKQRPKSDLRFAKRLLNTRQKAILWCLSTNLDLPTRCHASMVIHKKDIAVLGRIIGVPRGGPMRLARCWAGLY